jgi:hypothetical protein
MKHLLICFLLIFGLLANIASAGEPREVELNDGSVLLGEIVSLEGDVLTLKSETLGLVKINASRIRNIRMKPGASDSEEDQFAKLRDSMMNDPEIMAMVLSLQDNPDVQEVLKDPELMQALSSGDIKALLSNPKIIKLLDNPKIQDIGKKALKQE